MKTIGISRHPMPAYPPGPDGPLTREQCGQSPECVAIAVGYFRLTNDFISIIEATHQDGRLQDLEQVKGYESDDVVETHAGGEYFLPTSIPLALRAGCWSDPSHTVVFRGPLRVDHDIAASILFPEMRDQNHYTFGLGVAKPRWQMDAAYDFSATRNRVGIVRCPVPSRASPA